MGRIFRNIKLWIQRRTRGWSDDECWNLDWQFFKWINSRFKQYKKDAIKIVDLEYYKYNYNGQEYTQLQLIDKIIELSNNAVDENYYYKMNDDTMKIIYKNKDEILDIFKLIYFQMWW